MIATELLVSAALGELAGDAALAVEEHIVSCGACAARFEALVRLGPALAALVRGGGAGLVATRELVDRLDAEGLISRRYALAPGSIVPCTVGATDRYSLVTLAGDLAGASRVDLVRGADRFVDVPFDARDGRVYLVTPSRIIRALPTMKIPLRLVAVDDGRERVLGDYTLDHTAP